MAFPSLPTGRFFTHSAGTRISTPRLPLDEKQVDIGVSLVKSVIVRLAKG
jgi:hypothetical protein